MAETTAPGILSGKRGLIMGVANNRSIAWGIAQAARKHGAELAFTYQGEALKKRVEPLAKELDAAVVGHCDVTEPATIDAVFDEVRRFFGPFTAEALEQSSFLTSSNTASMVAGSVTSQWPTTAASSSFASGSTRFLRASP